MMKSSRKRTRGSWRKLPPAGKIPKRSTLFPLFFYVIGLLDFGCPYMYVWLLRLLEENNLHACCSLLNFRSYLGDGAPGSFTIFTTHIVISFHYVSHVPNLIQVNLVRPRFGKILLYGLCHRTHVGRRRQSTEIVSMVHLIEFGIN